MINLIWNTHNFVFMKQFRVSNGLDFYWFIILRTFLKVRERIKKPIHIFFLKKKNQLTFYNFQDFFCTNLNWVYESHMHISRLGQFSSIFCTGSMRSKSQTIKLTRAVKGGEKIKVTRYLGLIKIMIFWFWYFPLKPSPP